MTVDEAYLKGVRYALDERRSSVSDCRNFWIELIESVKGEDNGVSLFWSLKSAFEKGFGDTKENTKRYGGQSSVF